MGKKKKKKPAVAASPTKLKIQQSNGENQRHSSMLTQPLDRQMNRKAQESHKGKKKPKLLKPTAQEARKPDTAPEKKKEKKPKTGTQRKSVDPNQVDSNSETQKLNTKKKEGTTKKTAKRQIACELCKDDKFPNDELLDLHQGIYHYNR